ncbi:hypothetical protein FB451DRAFT_1400984 [Mycena latifolia]|nr:hypothetical protein FB451DRAFT_1400984 [Mycena latifolia]
MTIVQRIAFPVSPTFASEPNIFNKPLKIVKSVPGYVRSFHGLQIDDGKTGYFITVWQSVENYTALVQGTMYADFLAALKLIASGELENHHVDVGGVEPSIALSAPTTELALFTLKAGVAAPNVFPFFEELACAQVGAKGAHSPCMWGPSKDSGNTILFFAGWDTVEAHFEAVKELTAEGTDLHRTIQALLEKSDFVLGHAHLVKHEA